MFLDCNGEWFGTLGQMKHSSLVLSWGDRCAERNDRVRFVSIRSWRGAVACVCCLWCLLCPSNRAFGIEEKLLSDLKTYVAREAPSAGPEATLGFYVSTLSDEDEVLSERADEPLIPASLQKLVLSLTALRLLGASYRFPSEIFLDNPPSAVDPEGKERVDFVPPVRSVGNLYFRGYGDPTIDSLRLSDIAQAVSQHGVSQVEDVIVDDTLLVAPPKSSGPNPSDAGLSAVGVNSNCFAVYIAPSRPATPATVSLTPGLSFKVINQVLTLRGREQSIAIDTVSRPLREVTEDALSPSPSSASSTVTVRGTIGVDFGGLVLWQALPDIPAAFRELFLASLKKAGIEVKGRVRHGEVPPKAVLLEQFHSKTLAEIIREMNHDSNNVMAGQILYALGQDERGYFRAEAGLKRVRKQLEQVVGLKYKNFTLEDGSGYDRRNRLTPRQIVLVLKEAANDFSVAPDFISSLPRFGEEGRLKGRELLSSELLQGLRGEELRGARVRSKSVWAKTGTLEGVSGLAGYAVSKAGERLVFAVMENNVKDKANAAAFEDGFVRTLIGVKKERSETDIQLK